MDESDKPQQTDGPGTAPSARPPVSSESELAECRSRCEEYLDTLKRVQADFINYQERMKREKEDLGKYAVEGLARELLAVADGLGQAIAAGRGESGGTLLEGVKLVERELHRIMARFGIALIEAKGARFDPSLHEAVVMQETADHEEMTVLQELRRGYLIHGRLLRPAQVQVARKPGS